MIKVVLVMSAAVIATVVAAKVTFELSGDTATNPVSQPWAQDYMEFEAWNGGEWSAWVRDNTFEQRPRKTTKWSSHANASLAFIGWHGNPWQAKVDGDNFLLAPRGDWQGVTERMSAIRYRDWQGNNQLRTLDQLRR